MKTRTLVSFDWAIKRLLRNKANFGILNGFLSELLKEEIVVQQILESEGNQADAEDKFNRLDLLCKNQKEELIIFEVQYYEDIEYFQRCLYSTSKVITEYISKGEPYSQVKKVYSINILYFDLGHGRDYIYIGRTNFVGLHDGDLLHLSEAQQVRFRKSAPHEIFPEYYLLKINNFDDVAKNSLDEWIYFLKNTELPHNYKAKGLSQVAEQLKYDNMDPVSKQKYDDYLNTFKVSESMIETARFTGKLEGEKKGRKEGREEGRKEGREEGINKAKVETILKCIEKGFSVSLISELVDIPEDEVQRIIRQKQG